MQETATAVAASQPAAGRRARVGERVARSQFAYAETRLKIFPASENRISNAR
jgi:hypothetical protein